MSNGLLRDLTEEEAEKCLRLAMQNAHQSVIRGTAIAGRRYGKKQRPDSNSREKVKIVQLRIIPIQILDMLVASLSQSIVEVIGTAGRGTGAQNLDGDEFEFRMKKVLRGTKRLYERVGIKFFKEVFESD